MAKHSKSPKSHTVHMIANAHLDPVWRWRWSEGYATTWSTFQSMIDRLRESDDFVFTWGGAHAYVWIEEADPAMFRQIQRYVKQGRWAVVNGWWVQPDCNIPTGESFARHALYSQRYTQQKFGAAATVGYNVDSFGHNAGLPQLLLESGMEHYVFMRPDPHEKALPAEAFWWEGCDGSRVLAARIPSPYCLTGDRDRLRDAIHRCRDAFPPELAHSFCFFGVGNHGGGPTKAAIAAIREIAADRAGPKVIFSDPSSFFSTIRRRAKSLPTVKGDLQYHSPGCFTSHSEVKQLNRLAEHRLIAAEKFGAMAHALLGQPCRNDEFERAWRRVLFNQFHDIMAGTSLKEAYDDSRAEQLEAIAIAEREQNAALHAIARRIDTSSDGPPVVVFNPHATPIKAPVEVQFNFIPRGQLVNADGEPVPFQLVLPTVLVNDARVVFEADVPPLGYECFYFDTSTPAPGAAGPTASGTTLENDHWLLQIDPRSGDIARLYDKAARRNVFRGAGNQAIVVEDRYDTWGHRLVAFDKSIGAFGRGKVTVIEQGPVRAGLRIERRHGGSTLTQDILLYRESRAIEIRNRVDWQEQWQSLKLAFPVNVRKPRATFEQAYAWIERPADGHETAAQRWVDVTASDCSYGLTLLNDAKYGFDVKGSTLRVTALRGCPYCWHHPAEPQEGVPYHFMDQGPQEFRLVLLPHRGPWQDARPTLDASVLNEPLVYAFQYPHAGTWPKRFSWISVEPANVQLAALKVAEDGDDLILRLFETTGRATKATVQFADGWQFSRKLRGGQLMTLRVDLGQRRVSRTNLLEQ